MVGNWEGPCQRVHGLAGRHGLIPVVLLQDKESGAQSYTAIIVTLERFGPGLLDDRNIGIGILPESEEIFVDGG